MKKIIIYPHGKLYIFCLVLIYIFLIGLGVLFTYSIYPFAWWSILLLCGDLIIIVLLILQTREILRYKMVIEDNKVCLKANRTLFLVRHKDLIIDFKGIKSIQFKAGVNLSVGFISAIVLNYDEKRMNYLNVMRFSRKQINYIIELIKTDAVKINGYEIEIKEADLQK